MDNANPPPITTAANLPGASFVLPPRVVAHTVAGLDGVAELWAWGDGGPSVTIALTEHGVVGGPAAVSFTTAQATALAHLLLDRAEAAGLMGNAAAPECL